MTQVRIQEAASWRLDEIYRYTREHWGETQADRYIKSLFDSFEMIESRGVISYPVPAEFGVQGFFYRHEKHFVYWRRLPNGDIGIVTLLHERMHLIERFQDDFFWSFTPAPCGPAIGTKCEFAFSN